MFDRLKNILKSQLSQGISKMETPEVLAEQAEMQLDSDLRQILEALTHGMANAKILQDKIQQAQEEISTWTERAKLSVQQNNDDVAKQALQKKLAATQNCQALESQFAEQEQLNLTLKSKHAELQARLNDFRLNKKQQISQMQATEAVAQINDLLAGASPGGMNHWEQKISQKEAQGQAMAEIDDPGAVEAKLKEAAKQERVEDELSSIKAQVKGIKIIEVKDPPTKDGL